MRRLLAILLAIVLLPAATQAAELGRGVNVLGYDPLWKDPKTARFQERHFKTIRDGGFQTVRVNLQAFAHMDGSNQLDPQWLATLDWIVKSALAQKLNVILDEHDYGPCGNDADLCRTRLTAFWRQVAQRYKDAPDTVVFEILNEPNGKLDAPAWNTLANDILADIRKTNPTRKVIIGPVFWNNLDYLDKLQLPEDDRNLIVTVHYYQPMEFTHQGASWTPQYQKLKGVSWGTPADLARLDADFDKVQAWAKAHKRPILLGEFGAYDRGGAALDPRVKYTSTVARAAEARGWAWAYWQFDSDFIVYDVKADAWVKPIRDALIP